MTKQWSERSIIELIRKHGGTTTTGGSSSSQSAKTAESKAGENVGKP